MADKLKIDEEETVQSVDPKDWPSLSGSLADLREGKFQSIAIGSAPERRQGRIRNYMGHGNDLTTL